jgi:hypothetical protein
MLRSVKNLNGFKIRATDGEIGRVDDFYFDDYLWIIRYLVADTGSWLLGRLVLLPTASLGYPKWEQRAFPVTLGKEQIENSPPIDADQPVSRQMEGEIHGYYGWPPYWSVSAYSAAREAGEPRRREGDPHLRSTNQVFGYHIQATDGEIGHIEDFIVQDETWTIRYMVVDTRNWLPGKRVLVSPMWATKLDWVEKKVHLDLRREVIEESPEFDPTVPVNREYEVRLYDYYGRPHYWTRV